MRRDSRRTVVRGKQAVHVHKVSGGVLFDHNIHAAASAAASAAVLKGT